MATFLLIRDGGSTDPASPPDPLPALSRLGWQPIDRFDGAGWRLWLHATFNEVAVPRVRTPAGEFATATGWFVCDGLTGEAALRRCLEQFDDRFRVRDRCRGHFNLVLFKGGLWHLLRDGLDAGRLYHDSGESRFSNAFLGVLGGVRHPEPSLQGCYEYAFNGATFGLVTPVRQILSTPPGSMTLLDGPSCRHLPLPDPLPWHEAPESRDHEGIAREYLDRLRELFRLYARLLDRPVRTAISGGYDSRLVLALLLDAGIRPELFVYGPEQGDGDVEVARLVARAAGLPLEVIDKRLRVDLPPERHAEHLARNFLAFDGWKPGGLFDSGVDLGDRLERGRNRALFSGAAGEIFRNFHYLPDRPLSLRQVVWSFYSRYRPDDLGAAFSPDAYADALTASLRQALDAPSGETPLPRGWTERAYPLFRGRFWTARELNLNLRFGVTLFPFLEPEILAGTWSIPFDCKRAGLLEARLIQLAAPELAALPSIYGHGFHQPPPWRTRLALAATLARPVWSRGYAYRLQYRQPRPLPFFLTPEWLNRVIDPSFPLLSPLFRVARIHDPELFNRVATLEYLFQHGGA